MQDSHEVTSEQRGALVQHKIPLRAPCRKCGGGDGRIVERGAQDCVWCLGCDAFQYNAPRTETGKAVRTVTTVHNGIRPKQRMRLLARAGGHCETCGKPIGAGGAELHAGHIVSVKRGLEMGLTDMELNDDENLLATCAECNLGLGEEPLPLKVLVGALMARLRRAKQ